MPKRSIEDLGELQRAVMETVWDMGKATVREVRDRLSERRVPAYTTILTVMQKLEKAGWLKHKTDGRTYIYPPRAFPRTSLAHVGPTNPQERLSG